MILATNHGGWQVEILDPKFPEKGWHPAVEKQANEGADGELEYTPLEPFDKREDAEDLLREMVSMGATRKDVEFRVYPVAVEKAKK